VSRSEGRGVGSRQAVTQHLEVFEEANLVTTSRRGEKLHYFNPRAALRYLRAVDCQVRALAAEGATRNEEAACGRKQMSNSTFVYVTYIRTTLEKVFERA
jgi:predicted transcriptional regulator